MKINFKYIFATVVLVGMFLFGRQCGVDSVDIPTYRNDTIIKSDTIRPDTMKIEIPKPYPVKGDSVLVEVPVPIPIDSLQLRAFFNKRFYKNNYRDTNGVYTVEDSIIGYLIHQRLYYRDFKPISIINSTIIPVAVQDGTTVAKRWEFRGGIDATPKNLFLDVEYQKDRLSYSGGYDPFNKQAKVGLKYTFARNKK